MINNLQNPSPSGIKNIPHQYLKVIYYDSRQ
jgi:hypothetical protein